jgi:hypothetical protein
MDRAGQQPYTITAPMTNRPVIHNHSLMYAVHFIGNMSNRHPCPLRPRHARYFQPDSNALADGRRANHRTPGPLTLPPAVKLHSCAGPAPAWHMPKLKADSMARAFLSVDWRRLASLELIQRHARTTQSYISTSPPYSCTGSPPNLTPRIVFTEAPCAETSR